MLEVVYVDTVGGCGLLILAIRHVRHRTTSQSKKKGILWLESEVLWGGAFGEINRQTPGTLFLKILQSSLE